MRATTDLISFKLVALTLMFGLLGSTALGATEAWAPTSGPTGGSVTAFVSSGTGLFAGTCGAGLYRSTDSGATWSRLTVGLPQLPTIVDLATAGGEVFLATETFGVFRSADDGDTWTPVNAGLPALEIHQLIARADDLLVLQGTALGGFLYRLTGLGSSWEPLPMPDGFTQIVARDSVILGVSGSAIGNWRTTDEGENWVLTEGNGLWGAMIDSFVIDGNKVIGVHSSSSQGRIFESVDDGDNWTAWVLPSERVRGLTVSGSTFLLFAGTDELNGPVYRSADGGETWEPASAGLPGGQGQYVNRIGVHGDYALAGSRKGASRSVDPFGLWEDANDGLIATHVDQLISDGTTLYATLADAQAFTVSLPQSGSAAMDTVFRSPDCGATWLRGTNGLPEGCGVTSLALSGTSILAGTIANGVFGSVDEGMSWAPMGTGLPTTYGGYCQVDHIVMSGSTMLAATRPRSVGGGHGVVRTMGGGVTRSNDGGATWASVNTGLPALGEDNPPDAFIYYPDPTGMGVIDGVVFLGTDYFGVFRSDDNGDTWTEANAGLPIFNDKYPRMTSFVQRGTDIFASSRGFYSNNEAGRGVFKSGDGGSAWTEVGGEFAGGRPVSSLVVYDGDLFASVGCPSQQNDFLGCEPGPGDGVYRSRDGGGTWERVGTALDGIATDSLCLQENGLYAGTSGHGVWSSELGQLEPIPTVSEWGMFVMALLVLGAGTIAFQRRRVA